MLCLIYKAKRLSCKLGRNGFYIGPLLDFYVALFSSSINGIYKRKTTIGDCFTLKLICLPQFLARNELFEDGEDNT